MAKSFAPPCHVPPHQQLVATYCTGTKYANMMLPLHLMDLFQNVTAIEVVADPAVAPNTLASKKVETLPALCRYPMPRKSSLKKSQQRSLQRNLTPPACRWKSSCNVIKNQALVEENLSPTNTSLLTLIATSRDPFSADTARQQSLDFMPAVRRSRSFDGDVVPRKPLRSCTRKSKTAGLVDEASKSLDPSSSASKTKASPIQDKFFTDASSEPLQPPRRIARRTKKSKSLLRRRASST